MARMAAGETGATFELLGGFGHRIAGVLRRHLSRLGVYDIEADELQGLVIDTCLMLEKLAGSWRPDGGALPWNWAGHRVGRIVSDWVGQHASEFDVERHEEVVIEQLSRADDELEEIEVLAGLCDENPACALFFEALERVATARDRGILLAMRTQSRGGRPISRGDRGPPARHAARGRSPGGLPGPPEPQSPGGHRGSVRPSGRTGASGMNGPFEEVEPSTASRRRHPASRWEPDVSRLDRRRRQLGLGGFRASCGS